MEKLIINTDGGARGNPGPAASAYLIQDQNGDVLSKGKEYIGIATNNIAEYYAVVLAVSDLKENYNNKNIKEVFFYLDSDLVVKQLSGQFKIKNEKLKKLATLIERSAKQLHFHVSYNYIPRLKNVKADALVNEALDENLPHVK